MFKEKVNIWEHKNSQIREMKEKFQLKIYKWQVAPTSAQSQYIMGQAENWNNLPLSS